MSSEFKTGTINVILACFKVNYLSTTHVGFCGGKIPSPFEQLLYLILNKKK